MWSAFWFGSAQNAWYILNKLGITSTFWNKASQTNASIKSLKKYDIWMFWKEFSINIRRKCPLSSLWSVEDSSSWFGYTQNDWYLLKKLGTTLALVKGRHKTKTAIATIISLKKKTFECFEKNLNIYLTKNGRTASHCGQWQLFHGKVT